MILARHSLETNARPESIWSRWRDVNAWPAWDPRLQGAALDGPFQAGTKGTLTGPGLRLAFLLAAVDPGLGFVLESALPGTRLRLQHGVEAAPRGARITVEIQLQGWLAWIHLRRLRRALGNDLPAALRALARIAERPL